MRNRAFLLGMGLAVVLTAGCRVSEYEDGEGVDIEPAPVEIGTDTQTVTVPDIDIGGDTAVDTTTTR
jgi:hypothetical protein